MYTFYTVFIIALMQWYGFWTLKIRNTSTTRSISVFRVCLLHRMAVLHLLVLKFSFFYHLLFMGGFIFGSSSFPTELWCQMVDILAPYCNFSDLGLNKTRECPSCHLFSHLHIFLQNNIRNLWAFLRRLASVSPHIKTWVGLLHIPRNCALVNTLFILYCVHKFLDQLCN
jgi:hypothetical protein